jgi:hypothetical protein
MPVFWFPGSALIAPNILSRGATTKVFVWEMSHRVRNPIKPRVAERRQVDFSDCPTHAVALRLRQMDLIATWDSHLRLSYSVAPQLTAPAFFSKKYYELMLINWQEMCGTVSAEPGNKRGLAGVQREVSIILDFSAQRFDTQRAVLGTFG